MRARLWMCVNAGDRTIHWGAPNSQKKKEMTVDLNLFSLWLVLSFHSLFPFSLSPLYQRYSIFSILPFQPLFFTLHHFIAWTLVGFSNVSKLGQQDAKGSDSSLSKNGWSSILNISNFKPLTLVFFGKSHLITTMMHLMNLKITHVSDSDLPRKSAWMWLRKCRHG